jgi:hemerythrin
MATREITQMELKWRQDLETGDSCVDGQHKELFQKIQDLIAACKQGRERPEISGLLVFLKQYVQSHFAAEMQLLKQHGSPLRQEHAEQHESLIHRLAALEKEYLHDGASLPVVTNSLKLTYEWLTWHVLEWDKKIKTGTNQF